MALLSTHMCQVPSFLRVRRARTTQGLMLSEYFLFRDTHVLAWITLHALYGSSNGGLDLKEWLLESSQCCARYFEVGVIWMVAPQKGHQQTPKE